MTAAEKKSKGIYLPESHWRALSNEQKAAHVKRAITTIRSRGQHPGMVQVGTAYNKKSGKTSAVFLKPRERKGPPRFRPTGVKGKSLASTHFVKMLNGASRGKPSVRRFMRADGTTMVGHDFLGTLVVADDAAEADLVLTISVNPVDLGFPALSVETQLHQQYVFENFAVHMVRSGTDFLTGDMLGWYDRDPDEEIPAGIEGLQVGYYKGGTSAAFKDGHTWSMPRFPGLPVLYTRDLSSDERLVNQSQFNLQVINPPSVFNGSSADQVELPLEFWASYQCKFMVKDITFATNATLPRAHMSTDGNQSTFTYDGKTTAGVFLLCLDSTDHATDVNWIPDLSNFGPGAMGLPGLFWGYRNNEGGPVVGMLAGYGYNKAQRFQIFWNSLKASHLTSLGVGTWTNVNATTTGGSGNGLVAPYTSTANAGSFNTQQSLSQCVVVDNPGEVQTPVWSSSDRLFFVDRDNTIKLMPYDNTREYIWAVNPTFTDTGTASLSLTAAEVQYVTVSLEQTESFGLFSPALKPGPATIEGLVKKKWETLDNKQRAEWDGNWQNLLKHVREKRRQKKREGKDPFEVDISPLEQKQERKVGPSPMDSPSAPGLALEALQRGRPEIALDIEDTVIIKGEPSAETKVSTKGLKGSKK